MNQCALPFNSKNRKLYNNYQFWYVFNVIYLSEACFHCSSMQILLCYLHKLWLCWKNMFYMCSKAKWLLVPIFMEHPTNLVVLCKIFGRIARVKYHYLSAKIYLLLIQRCQKCISYNKPTLLSPNCAFSREINCHVCTPTWKTKTIYRHHINNIYYLIYLIYVRTKNSYISNLQGHIMG